MLGFGGLLLILLLVSGLSIGVLTRYSSALDQVFRENYDSAVYCDRMKQAIDALNSRAQQIVWQGAAGDQSQAPAMRDQFDENLRKQIHNITLGSDEKRLTEQIRQSWLGYGLTYDRFESAADRQQKLVIFRDDLLKDYERVRTAAQATEDLNIANMVSVDARVKRMLGSVRDTLIIFALAGILLAVALLAAVGATVLRPLQALTRSARQIGEGDLNLQVAVKARDEIGQLSDAFNLMASRLREFRRIDLERLQRTQETTQLAIDSLPDAVFVIGPGGVVEISNLTSRSHFAVSPGTTLQSLQLAWLDKIYAEVCASRKPCDPQGYASAIQLFENGHERFLLPRAVPMTNGVGELMGVTVILVDVTRLRHADELKSGLVSTVSHELRTPLTAIRMAVLMLVSGKLGKLSAVQTKALEAARVDSDRLYRTIDNLLSMSRLDSGGQKFQFRRMAIEEIVRQAVDPLREQIDSKRLMFAADIASGLPSVLADASCVGYVLANLLANAIKFTPPGGSVTLAASLEGDEVMLAVSDSGPGIPPEFRSHLFQRFYRVPRVEGPSGAGLGLSIAKEIVEAHGGRIVYADRPGGGSVFRFTLRSDDPTASPGLEAAG
jgi:signal transduction histidine kinase